MKALITGVNSLVNQALLDRLIALKYQVVAHYHTDNDITAQLKKTYSSVSFVAADFADSGSFTNFLNHAIKHGKYDVVINGAVYYAEANNKDAQLSWEQWQQSYAINTTSAGMIMVHADELINTNGVIINISSTYGQTHMGDTQFTIYSSSKAALDSLTKNYAKAWRQLNIRVVGIGPGWVRSAWNKDMTKHEIEEMISPHHLTLTKLVEPEEIADLVVCVINNPSINATTLIIDGGLSAPNI